MIDWTSKNNLEIWAERSCSLLTPELTMSGLTSVLLGWIRNLHFVSGWHMSNICKSIDLILTKSHQVEPLEYYFNKYPAMFDMANPVLDKYGEMHEEPSIRQGSKH